MKVTKKLFALLMALVMIMGLGLTASAASITINNAADGETYTAYKLFDVSIADNATSYSYYIENTDETSALITLLTGEDINLDLTLSADGSRYNVNTVDVGDTGTSVTEFKTKSGSMSAAELAVKLNEIVDSLKTATTSKSAVATSNNNNTVATITDLDAGYYFVNTTMGSLCILNTTDQAEIVEKNEAPDVEKDVQTPTENDTVQIGDTVTYTIAITAQPGAENYVLHDRMSDGLTLDEESLKVAVGETELTAGNEYTVDFDIEVSDEDPDCAFEISFTESYLNSITAETTITVTYEAVVNEDAVVGTDPITNKAILDYGEASHVETDKGKTEIYTYNFELVKVDGSETPQQLTGAEFKLYSTETGGNAIQFIHEEGTNTYRVATQTEIDEKISADTITVGSATITGLAGKSYWLEETKAPDGYHKLTERVEVEFVTLGEDNQSLTLAESYLADQSVENEAGALLPSTGGMGTTVIYIIGAVLVIGAGIVLVVRRRTNA